MALRAWILAFLLTTSSLTLVESTYAAVEVKGLDASANALVLKDPSTGMIKKVSLRLPDDIHVRIVSPQKILLEQKTLKLPSGKEFVGNPDLIETAVEFADADIQTLSINVTQRKVGAPIHNPFRITLPLDEFLDVYRDGYLISAHQQRMEDLKGTFSPEGIRLFSASIPLSGYYRIPDAKDPDQEIFLDQRKLDPKEGIVFGWPWMVGTRVIASTKFNNPDYPQEASVIHLVREPHTYNWGTPHVRTIYKYYVMSDPTPGHFYQISPAAASYENDGSAKRDFERHSIPPAFNPFEPKVIPVKEVKIADIKSAPNEESNPNSTSEIPDEDYNNLYTDQNSLDPSSANPKIEDKRSDENEILGNKLVGSPTTAPTPAPSIASPSPAAIVTPQEVEDLVRPEVDKVNANPIAPVPGPKTAENKVEETPGTEQGAETLVTPTEPQTPIADQLTQQLINAATKDNAAPKGDAVTERNSNQAPSIQPSTQPSSTAPNDGIPEVKAEIKDDNAPDAGTTLNRTPSTQASTQPSAELTEVKSDTKNEVGDAPTVPGPKNEIQVVETPAVKVENETVTTAPPAPPGTQPTTQNVPPDQREEERIELELDLGDLVPEGEIKQRPTPDAPSGCFGNPEKNAADNILDRATEDARQNSPAADSNEPQRAPRESSEIALARYAGDSAMRYQWNGKQYVVGKFQTRPGLPFPPRSAPWEDAAWVLAVEDFSTGTKRYMLPEGGSNTELPPEVQDLIHHLQNDSSREAKVFLKKLNEKHHFFRSNALDPKNYVEVRERSLQSVLDRQAAAELQRKRDKAYQRRLEKLQRLDQKRDSILKEIQENELKFLRTEVGTPEYEAHFAKVSKDMEWLWRNRQDRERRVTEKLKRDRESGTWWWENNLKRLHKERAKIEREMAALRDS